MSGRWWALAALQAAVAVSWKAYAFFQPRLLEHFGFATLAGIFGWYLALAGSTLAPLAGNASDRLVRGGGNRLPIVRAGVALAAVSFGAVAVTAAAEAGSPVRWVLPLFIAVWIAGMTIFQAPGLAFLRDGGDEGAVNAAIAPVVAATMLPTALWPWLEPVLARVGGSVTFLAGGIAVTATALVLGRVAPTPAASPTEGGDEANGAGRWLGAFACGLVSAAVVVLASELVPNVLAARAPVGEHGLAAIVGLAASAIALGGRRMVAVMGHRAGLLVGLVVVGVARAIAPSCAGAGAVVVAAFTGAGLGLHLATALPFALRGSGPGRAGLVAGLYVGGAMLGSRLVWLVAG